MGLFEDILISRHISSDSLNQFLNPQYEDLGNPFLLPDMKKAVNRLVEARKNNEKITIYGDYDIDGLTATTLLHNALTALGFDNVSCFIPNRFIEGYGLTNESIELIASTNTSLIITVDCGSLSFEPIKLAKKLAIDVIVTDHHNVAEVQPEAVAVINPKRKGHKYPFKELAGVGVAFKLVQALQTMIDGLEPGQEKWLLDLVALGTVCDVVPLVDENRILVYYGLKVMNQTRRPGLIALKEVAGINSVKITSRDLAFGLGPRLNASGRLETAQHSLNLLMSRDISEARRYALVLDNMNLKRKESQAMIYKEAAAMAEEDNSSVLVLSSPNWNHGIVGIVAAKIMETYHKPTFVLQEMDKMTKGSARSFGDFSVADAIFSVKDMIISGGGHNLAAGVSLPVGAIEDFRKGINNYYLGLSLKNQADFLVPSVDADVNKIEDLNLELVSSISQLEPFGNGNQDPVFKLRTDNFSVSLMGKDLQHLRMTVSDGENFFSLIKFNAPDGYKKITNRQVEVIFTIYVNEWNGRRAVEGKIIHIKIV